MDRDTYSDRAVPEVMAGSQTIVIFGGLTPPTVVQGSAEVLVDGVVVSDAKQLPAPPCGLQAAPEAEGGDDEA